MPTKKKVKTTKPTTLLYKLPVQLDTTNKKVYVEEYEGNLRLGTGGESLEAGALLGAMSKGEARRVRKALAKEGFHEQAAATRQSALRLSGDSHKGNVRP